MINFEDCIENRIHNIREILLAKAEEYATGDNRFYIVEKGYGFIWEDIEISRRGIERKK